MISWKLFEERNGYPISLVHGMPFFDGTRSRMFPLDVILTQEEGTPGFNCFLELDKLIAYLPRFRVRAPRLCICAVDIGAYEQRTNYILTPQLLIHSSEWDKRLRGIDVL